MINVLGFPIIYAFIPNDCSIDANIDPQPGTLKPLIIVNLSGLVPKNLAPLWRWNPIKQDLAKVISESQPTTIPSTLSSRYFYAI